MLCVRDERSPDRVSARPLAVSFFFSIVVIGFLFEVTVTIQLSAFVLTEVDRSAWKAVNTVGSVATVGGKKD